MPQDDRATRGGTSTSTLGVNLLVIARELGSKHFHPVVRTIMVEQGIHYELNGGSYLVSPADAERIKERFDRLHRPLLRGPRTPAPA